MIYFDNAASTKPMPQAVSAMNAVLDRGYSNPNALHKGGIEAEKLLINSRKSLLSRLPKGGSLIFTSGATESNNLAILGCLKNRGNSKKGNRIVTTAVEHPSVSRVIDGLKPEYEIIRLSPDDDIISRVDNDTAFVSVTAVCSETGFVTDVTRLYGEVKRRFPDCVFHVDGAQGFTKTDVAGDLISLSAHKIGGIPGVGGLYIKDGVRVKPLIFGGNQQNGLRSGTEPVGLIAAFAVAAETAFTGDCDFLKLRDGLTEGLRRLDLKINSRNNVPNIVNFSCNVKSEVMLHFLAENGIYVSSGSACSKGKKSEILPAYGIGVKDIDTAIRVSFGWHNTCDEVDVFLEVVESGIKKLRR